MKILLIVLICLLVLLNFLFAYFWRKKYFVKEVYFEKKVPIILCIITVVCTVVMLVSFFLGSKDDVSLETFVLIVFVVDLPLLISFNITFTTCIYLQHSALIYTNLFCTKKIVIDTNVNIIEKTDKMTIKSEKCSISISYRHLCGNIKELIYKINLILNRL